MATEQWDGLILPASRKKSPLPGAGMTQIGADSTSICEPFVIFGPLQSLFVVHTDFHLANTFTVVT